MKNWPIIGIILLLLIFLGTFVWGANIVFPTFTSLLDTPDSYSGQAGKGVFVNSDENGLIFADANGGSGGFVDWNQLINFPADCTSGQFVYGVDTILNCDFPANFPGNGDVLSTNTIVVTSGGANMLFGSTDLTLETIQDISVTGNPTFQSLGITDIITTNDLQVNDDANLVHLTWSDANGPVDWNQLVHFPANCSSGQFVRGIGKDLNCATPGGTPVDFNGDILGKPNQITVTNGTNRLFGPADVNLILPQDINTTSIPTFAGGIFTSGASTIAVVPSFNVITFANPAVDASFSTSSPNLNLQSGDGTGDVILSSFNSIRPIVNNATSLGSSTIHFNQGHITDLNVYNKFDVDGNSYFGGTIQLDANIVFGDINKEMGTLAVPLGRLYSNNIQCVQSAQGNCMTVMANTFVFSTANPGQGLTFRTGPQAFEFQSFFNKVFRFNIASTNIGMWSVPLRTTDPTADLNSGNQYFRNTGVDGDGNIMQMTRSGHGTWYPTNSILQGFDFNTSQDVNIGRGINWEGSQSNPCIGIAKLTAGIATVTTSCMKDNNSLIQLTGQGSASTPANTGFYWVSGRTPNTDFNITSSNVLDDANVGWEIKQVI